MQDYYGRNIARHVRRLEEAIDSAPVTLDEALTLYELARDALQERVDCLEEECAQRGLEQVIAAGLFDEDDG